MEGWRDIRDEGHRDWGPSSTTCPGPTSERVRFAGPGGGYGHPMSTALAAHDHVWHLQAVHLEEGLSTQEFACADCGAVDFR